EYTVPASGPYPPIFEDLYDPELMPPLTYDPEGAASLPEARGWVDGDGDGIGAEDGTPCRYTLGTDDGKPRRADIAQIVQQQWRRIGVDVELRSLEFNTLMDQLLREEYQAALNGWGVGLSPDLKGMWGPDSPYNIVSYDD